MFMLNCLAAGENSLWVHVPNNWVLRIWVKVNVVQVLGKLMTPQNLYPQP